MDITAALAEAPYPGRGVLVFGASAHELGVVYFLTGRSEASRRRKLVPSGPTLTAASTVGDSDDPLRHYRAAVRTDQWDIIGNGDQVDQLATALSGGATWELALATVDPEPDPPLHTARIFVAVDRSGSRVVIGAARSRRSSELTDRVLDFTDDLGAGEGVLITTYRGDPATPATAATPLWLDCEGGLESVVDRTWSALDDRYRVALAGRLVTSEEWLIRSAE